MLPIKNLPGVDLPPPSPAHTWEWRSWGPGWGSQGRPCLHSSQKEGALIHQIDLHWGLSLTWCDPRKSFEPPRKNCCCLHKGDPRPEAPKPVTSTGLIRMGINTETHCPQERPRETFNERQPHSWLMEKSDTCMGPGSLGLHSLSWRWTCQASL